MSQITQPELESLHIFQFFYYSGVILSANRISNIHGKIKEFYGQLLWCFLQGALWKENQNTEIDISISEIQRSLINPKMAELAI
jgi:hypothetical protein